MIPYEMLIIFLAGWGAGVVTGLIGASAVAVVNPMLVIFLGYDVYQAIGIGLSVDVFSSSASASIYKRFGNIDIRHGVQMAVSAVFGALVGSWVSSYFPAGGLIGGTGIINVAIGATFILRPDYMSGEALKHLSVIEYMKRNKFLSSIVFGLGIGVVCGVVGAGGGIMILLALVLVLDYQIHRAVGTSVLIMIFIAFAGAVGHAVYGDFNSMAVLIGGAGGVLGAMSASTFANLASERTLKKVVGVCFAALGLGMMLTRFIF